MRQSRAADTVELTQPDADTLVVSGPLTFATASRALAAGSHAVAGGTQTRLDLSHVTRADSAGLACVLALAALASSGGRRLHVTHWPEGLRALAVVCGTVELLEPPPRPAA